MKYLLVFSVLFVFGCDEAQSFKNKTKINNTAEEVTMSALVANPEAFNGKRIRVVGAINVDYESRMLCAHADDVTKGRDKNCIWVSISGNSLQKTEKEILLLKNYYVLAEGSFDSALKDGRCSGALKNISRLDQKEGF